MFNTPCLSAVIAGWVLLFLWSASAFARYDDTVFLNNGDRLSGDVKELSRDMLRFKTDSMGTVYIRWGDIRSLETGKSLRIELKSGLHLVGSISRSGARGQLVVSTSRRDEMLPFSDVVAFVPLKLESSWFDRLEGSVKFGLNSTKGSNTTQWNVGVNALYRGPSWEVISRLDSNVTDRSDDTTSERISFLTAYRHLLRNRWFWATLASYDKNDELGINDRYSGGGGVGRYLFRSNSVELLLQSGLLVSREFRTDTADDQLEAYLGGSLAWFRHSFPRTDIRTDVLVLPSLTDSGRVRTNLDVSVKREFVEDLFLDLSVYFSTDNKPPNEASREDWGVVTSIGYSF